MNAPLTDIACRIFGILKRERREKKSIKELNKMTLGEIKQLQKDYEKDLKEILIHYFETHPHCREIIMKPPYPFQLPMHCDAELFKDMEYRVRLNTKENF